jgi:hypothetical protein
MSGHRNLKDWIVRIKQSMRVASDSSDVRRAWQCCLRPRKRPIRRPLRHRSCRIPEAKPIGRRVCQGAGGRSERTGVFDPVPIPGARHIGRRVSQGAGRRSERTSVFGPVRLRLCLRLVLPPRRLRHSQPVDKRLGKRNGYRIQNLAISSDSGRGWIVFQTHTKPGRIAVAQDIRYGQLHGFIK